VVVLSLWTVTSAMASEWPCGRVSGRVRFGGGWTELMRMPERGCSFFFPGMAMEDRPGEGIA